MENNLRIEKPEKNDNTSCRSLTGSLFYIPTATRPDISYSVGYLSRFQNYLTPQICKYDLRS